MHVSVIGLRSKRFENIVLKATEYYMSMLIPRHISRHITLDVEFEQKLDDKADGFCEVVSCNQRKKPREFLIQIQKNKSQRYMLMTLAHEIVHLKQYAMGELDENMNVWKGRRVHSKTDYWDTPWEIEAHGREAGLYTRFCEKYKLKFKKTAYERDN
jgi:histidinol phosphatase-like enzyme